MIIKMESNETPEEDEGIEITKGPLKGKKIYHAPYEKVDAYKEEIAIVLEAVGHPEAWITDKSAVGDFFFGSDEEDDEELKQIGQELGFEVKYEDLLWEVAEKLSKKRNS